MERWKKESEEKYIEHDGTGARGCDWLGASGAFPRGELAARLSAS